MALTRYAGRLEVAVAEVTVIGPRYVTAGGEDYRVPPSWGDRLPEVGDRLVETAEGRLAWIPQSAWQALELTPLAGPFNVGDAVVCVRENPPTVMTVAQVVAEGYYCTAYPRTLNPLFFVAADLQAAP
jgi:hypothetical protein